MGAFGDIWNGIIDIVLAPFRALGGLLTDIFGDGWFQELKEKFNIGAMIKKMFAKIKIFVADMFDWIPGLGGTLDEMRTQAQQDLAELEMPDQTQVVMMPGGGEAVPAGGGDNISMNPTTIMVNDTDRSMRAMRRSRRNANNDVDDF